MKPKPESALAHNVAPENVLHSHARVLAPADDGPSRHFSLNNDLLFGAHVGIAAVGAIQPEEIGDSKVAITQG